MLFLDGPMSSVATFGSISLREGADERRTHSVGAHDYTACRPFSGTAGATGTRRGGRLSGWGGTRLAPGDSDEPTRAERRASMALDQVRGRLWAQRRKLLLNIDIEICSVCGGAVRFIAHIEDPVVIEKVPSIGPLPVHPCTTPLTHLDKRDPAAEPPLIPPRRAPPQGGLFD